MTGHGEDTGGTAASGQAPAAEGAPGRKHDTAEEAGPATQGTGGQESRTRRRQEQRWDEQRRGSGSCSVEGDPDPPTLKGGGNGVGCRARRP